MDSSDSNKGMEISEQQLLQNVQKLPMEGDTLGSHHLSPSKRRKVLKKPKKYFVAIHLGVGKHALKQKSQDSYTDLCKRACRQAIKILKDDGSADDAVTAATIILENSRLVNAGRGSELNLEKKVECDAGFMNGAGYFGGVGGVGGVPNPILVARKIAQLQFTKENLKSGVVPPMLLTGLGAKTWAASQGIPTCEDHQLVSERALRRYDKLSDFKSNGDGKSKHSTLEDDDNDEEVNDTVGAIALDFNGHVAASVSSGGNILKFPGRIGHSPIFGCGCWASDKSGDDETSVAVSTTGVGEMLTKLRWAHECASCLRNDEHNTPVEAMSFAINEKFLDSPLLNLNHEPKLIGGVALVWDGKHGEFIWGYKSPTFIFGYAGSMFDDPHVQILSSYDNLDQVHVGGLAF